MRLAHVLAALAAGLLLAAPPAVAEGRCDGLGGGGVVDVCGGQPCRTDTFR